MDRGRGAPPGNVSRACAGAPRVRDRERVHHKQPAAFGATAAARAETVALLLEGITLEPLTEASMRGAAALVSRTRWTFHDASYLDLAKRGGGILVTNDEMLLRAGKDVLGRGAALTLREASAAVERGTL